MSYENSEYGNTHTEERKESNNNDNKDEKSTKTISIINKHTNKPTNENQ